MKTRGVASSVACALGAGLLAFGTCTPAAVYRLTDLGVGDAFALNAAGQVVGAGGSGHAFLYSAGTVIDLQPQLAAAGLDLISYAYGINDRGEVVGFGVGDSLTKVGFRYDGSVEVVEGAEELRDINNAGLAVGFKGNRALLFEHGVVTPIDLATALAVNETGQVAGAVSYAGHAHPALYDDGRVVVLEQKANNGAIWDVNDSGQSAGTVDNVAFMHDGRTFSELPLPAGSSSCTGLGIDPAGAVLGYCYPDSGGWLPFLYRDGAMQDLNELLDATQRAAGWVIEIPSDINATGQIAGTARNAVGDHHAVLLTPVPEPATALLLVAGACGVAAAAGRRRTATRPGARAGATPTG